jgi:GNAT superfamily N-acetyltransferase
MVNIRIPREDDMAQAKRVANRYSKDTLLGILTPEQLDKVCDACLSNGIVLVAESEGIVVGVIAAQYIQGLSMGKFADEIIWYVEPEHRGIGLMLFDQFLEGCKRDGCTGVCMVAYNNNSFDMVDMIYKRKGFREIERKYFKEL